MPKEHEIYRFIINYQGYLYDLDFKKIQCVCSQCPYKMVLKSKSDYDYDSDIYSDYDSECEYEYSNGFNGYKTNEPDICLMRKYMRKKIEPIYNSLNISMLSHDNEIINLYSEKQISDKLDEFTNLNPDVSNIIIEYLFTELTEPKYYDNLIGDINRLGRDMITHRRLGNLILKLYKKSTKINKN